MGLSMRIMNIILSVLLAVTLTAGCTKPDEGQKPGTETTKPGDKPDTPGDRKSVG